ncbi:MAG: TonB-dependent receptor, partial [Gemmatimonadota bacterium]|nr:TonB-dependent receptor [Gemmatimonadota bacterium]
VEVVARTMGLEILLDRSAYVLPPIEVLRSRTELARGLDDIPGSVQVIGRVESLKLNPLGDVHETLRMAPGVQVQDEEGFGLRPNIGLRGTGLERSSKITVMEDGVLIAPAPYAAPSAYYFPAAARMHAIEVRKGSSQIQYGPRTIGGAVNLVSTPVPNSLSFEGDVAGGAHGTSQGRVSVGSSGRHIGWLVEGYRINSDGFKVLPDRRPTGFVLNDFLAKVRLRTDTRRESYQELQVKVGYNQQRADETYLGLTQEDFSIQPFARYAASQQDELDLEHRQLAVRHFIRPGGRFDLTTTVYHNTFFRNWFKLQSVTGRPIASVVNDPAGYPTELGILRGEDSGADALNVRANSRNYLSQGVQTVAGFNFGSSVRHKLQVGARWHRDEEDRFQHEDSFQMLTGTMLLTTAGTPGSQSNGVSDAVAGSAYILDDIEIGSWVLSPGVRYENVRFRRLDYASGDSVRVQPARVRENSVAQLMPGLGMSFKWSESVRIFGGIHRGFAPPGPGANEETRPESSNNFELGIRLQDEAFSGEIVSFVTDYRNILGAATLSSGGDGSGDLFNGGAVKTAGVEVSFAHKPIQVPGQGVVFPAGFALTYTNARFQSSFSSVYAPWGDVEEGFELPYVAPLTLHAFAGAAFDIASIRLGFDYSSAVRTLAGLGTPPPDQRIDARLVISLTTELEIGQFGQAFVTARNLTNEKYVVARRPAGLRPGLPRTVMAGMRIKP